MQGPNSQPSSTPVLSERDHYLRRAHNVPAEAIVEYSKAKGIDGQNAFLKLPSVDEFWTPDDQFNATAFRQAIGATTEVSVAKPEPPKNVLRFDGLYFYYDTTNDTTGYVRFYEDGKLAYADRVTGKPDLQSVAKWLEYGHAEDEQGRYSINGTQVKIVRKVATGYSGYSYSGGGETVNNWKPTGFKDVTDTASLTDGTFVIANARYQFQPVRFKSAPVSETSPKPTTPTSKPASQAQTDFSTMEVTELITWIDNHLDQKKYPQARDVWNAGQANAAQQPRLAIIFVEFGTTEALKYRESEKFAPDLSAALLELKARFEKDKPKKPSSKK